MSLLKCIEQLKEFDTALLANTIGYTDNTPPEQWYMAGDIQSVTPALGPTVGVAVTCTMDSSSPDTDDGDMEGYWQQLEQMDQMSEPSVWVVQAVGSRPKHECVIGDGMAKTLYASGCVGLVTNGGIRDVQGLLTTPFAAYSRGTTIHHCSLRIREFNVAVEVGGITVNPGDIIHANHEGVIKISGEHLDDLLALAPKYSAFEYDAHKELRRTDISPANKRKKVDALLEQYGLKVSRPTN